MNKAYLELLQKAVDNNFPQELATLQKAVSFPSVQSAPVVVGAGTPEEERFPYGVHVHRVFSYVLEKGQEMGLDTVNVDNYGGHLQYNGMLYNAQGETIGTAETTIGIIGHLDVVPEGEGWIHPPYEGVVENGRIYGRGVLDDKGPLLAGLYGLKAVLDAGLKPQANVRIILGLDEENGLESIEKYLEKEKQPDLGFTPDAEFPVIHGEKEMLIFDLARKFAAAPEGGLELRSITGGDAPNKVPAHARALLFDKKGDSYEAIREKAALWNQEGKGTLKVRKLGKSLEVTAVGKSAHGASPWLGANAIAILLGFLGELTFSADDVNDFLSFYNTHIGMELDGQSLGGYAQDPLSGHTILNVGMIELDKKAVRLTINARLPFNLTGEDFYQGIGQTCAQYDIGIIKESGERPLYFEKDHVLVKTLMDVYREHTEDENAQPLVIAGGTYARAFDHVVAFGALFPGEEDNMHQAEESISLDCLKKATLLFADAIVRLTEAC